MIERYSHICLDLDGTLTDTAVGMDYALKTTLREFGLESDEYPQWLEVFTRINNEYWSKCDKGELFTYQMRYDQMIQFLREITQLSMKKPTGSMGAPKEIIKTDFVDIPRFAKAFTHNFAVGSPYYPGAEAVLRKISQKRPVTIITNGFKEVQKYRLKSLRLNRYIDYMVISQEVGVAKPRKEIFHAAFRAMGNPEPSRVLMVGDSLSADIEGGADYGMDTCWVAYGQKQEIGYAHGATYVVDTLKELIKES